MRLCPGHPFFSADANGGGSPVNPFSAGGIMSERSVAERVPTSDRKLHAERPPESETPPPERPEPDSPPAEATEPAPAPEKIEPPEREVPAVEEKVEEPKGSEEPQAATGDEEYPEAVQKLLGKFGDVQSLAEGYGELRGLQSKTAEKLKEVLSYFDHDDSGRPVLKAEKASERLREMRGGESVDYGALTQEIPLEYVEKYVEKQWRDNWAAQGIDAEGISELLEQNKPMLKQHATSEHQRAKAMLAQKRQSTEDNTRRIIASHIQASPKDEKLLPKFAEMMDTLPLDVGLRIVNEGGLGGVKRIFKLLRAEADYADDIRAAYKAGKEHASREVEATVGGSPASTSKAPAKQRGGGEDQELQAWKDQLVNPRKSTLERMGLT